MVVRVRLRLRRSAPPIRAGRSLRVDERWTLGRTGEQWTLRAVDVARSPAAVLDQRLIPDASADEDRLQEQSLTELAEHDQLPANVALTELINTDLPPRRPLAELSQLDGRFDPALVHAVLRHIVEAWEEASTGTPQPLHDLCGEDATCELLQPAPRNPAIRFVITEPGLEDWHPIRLEVAAHPARMTVSVDITAIRYLANAATGEHLAGNPEYRHPLQLIWTLALCQARTDPWRLIATTNPAAGIPNPPDEVAADQDRNQADEQILSSRAARLQQQIEVSQNRDRLVTEHPTRPPTARTTPSVQARKVIARLRRKYAARGQ